MAAMLTLYKARRSKSEDSKSSDSENVIPAGTLAVTKRNGKLFLTRSKQPTTVDIATDLIGHAFGGKVKIIRKRAKSLERVSEKTPLLIDGVPHLPQLQTQNTAPLLQQEFAPPIPMPPPFRYWQIPPQYAQYPPPPDQHIPANSAFNLNPSLGCMPHYVPATVGSDKLKDIDAHFRKVSMDKTRVPSDEGVTNVMGLGKPTVAITKHICANCGILRSKKFHDEHPIKPGDEPAPTFCRKCQRDDSSTSDSESEREDRKSRKKNENKRMNWVHRKQKRAVEDFSGSELTVGPRHKRGPKSVLKKITRDRIPEADHIIAEEWSSEDDESHRGRSRQREDFQQHDPTDERHQDYTCTSPLHKQPNRQKSFSDNRRDRYTIPRQHQNPQRRRAHPHSSQDSMHSRQSSVSLRYVQVSESREPEPVAETYPKKVQIHFIDEGYNYKPTPKSRSPTTLSEESHPRKTHREDVHPRQRQPSASSVRREQDSRSSISPKRDCTERVSYVRSLRVGKADSLDSVVSSRSQESVVRRRRERRANTPASAESWKTPHISNLGPSDDATVVTERYEYRPKRTMKANEEERRGEEYQARDILSLKGKKSRSSAREVAAQYYSDDWSREEMLAKRREQTEVHYSEDWSKEESETRTGHPKRESVWPEKSGWGQKRQQPGSWRRDAWNDSELGCSEANYRYPVDEPENAPRVAKPFGQRPKVPVPTDSDLTAAYNVQRSRRGRGRGCQPSSEDTVLRRPHKAPKPRPAYVRGSSDEDRALIPSPRSSSSTSLILSPHVAFGQDEVHCFEDRSCDRSAEYEVEEATSDLGSTLSGMTDAETELTSKIEKVVRRVMFRDDMSQRSVRSEKIDGRHERFYDIEYDSEDGSGGEIAVWGGGGGGGEWVGGGEGW